MLNLRNFIVICDRCGKEIMQDEPIWYIRQFADYPSRFDNEHISKEICEDCLEIFMTIAS